MSLGFCSVTGAPGHCHSLSLSLLLRRLPTLVLEVPVSVYAGPPYPALPTFLLGGCLSQTLQSQLLWPLQCVFSSWSLFSVSQFSWKCGLGSFCWVGICCSVASQGALGVVFELALVLYMVTRGRRSYCPCPPAAGGPLVDIAWHSYIHHYLVTLLNPSAKAGQAYICFNLGYLILCLKNQWNW